MRQPDIGNFPTRAKAEYNAKRLRKNVPRLKPVYVKKAKIRGWDVYTSK